MKDYISITDSRKYPGDKKKRIHETDDGKLFVGPPIEADVGDVVVVEVSDGPEEDGYIHILKVVGIATR